MRKLRILVRKDLVTVYRDRLMLLVLVIPLVAAAAMRGLLMLRAQYLPWLPPEVHVLMSPVVVMLPAFLVGTVGGLGLVAERETRAGISLRVMPVPGWLVTSYLCGWQAAVAAALAPLCLWVYGLMPESWAGVAVMGVALSMSAGLVSILLGSLAANRIEAMAVSKFLGILLWTIAPIFLVSPQAQLAVAWSPWYWGYVGVTGAVAGEGAAAIALLRWPAYSVGVAGLACLMTSIGWIAVLSRRYLRRVD
jgi:hypothetical protein